MERRSGRRRAPFDARAALRGEIEDAMALLARPPLTDESIHAFRQALKRARASLRLLRDAVSETAYATENACLRDAARPLARARDAAVTLDLLDELLASHKMRRYRPALLPLRAKVRQSHARSMARAGDRRVAGKMRRRLEQSLGRTAHWRMPRDPLPVYASGLRRIYRRGRDALESALARGSASALHEWRKQVKYLGATLVLAVPASSRRARAQAVTDEIARRLGEHHDLTLLAGQLRRTSGARGLASKLDEKRRKLRKRAIKLSRRLDERCRPLLRY